LDDEGTGDEDEDEDAGIFVNINLCFLRTYSLTPVVKCSPVLCLMQVKSG